MTVRSVLSRLALVLFAFLLVPGATQAARAKPFAQEIARLQKRLAHAQAGSPGRSS